MNRQNFGKWGIELKPEEFAGALASLFHELYEETPPDILSKLIGVKDFERISDVIENNTPIRLCFDSTYHLEDFQNLPPASDDNRNWLDFVDELKREHEEKETERFQQNQYILEPRPFRLRLELITNPENAFWLTEQLSQLKDDKFSVYLRTDEPGTEVGWNWALKVGFLEDENSQQLRKEFEKYINEEENWLQPLVEFVNLNSENDNCDLLIIPESLRSALSLAMSLRIKISADCILIIGLTSEIPKNVPSLIDTLRRFINTAGVGIVNVARKRRTNWFAEFIRELAHNEPLDVALFEACRKTDTPTPFLTASHQLVKFSRLAESIKSLGKAIKNFDTDKTIEISDEDAGNFGIEADEYNLDDLGEIFMHRSNEFHYDRESTSATSAAYINKEFKEIPDTAEKSNENQSRWIQAQVYDVSRQNERIRLRRALLSNVAHEAVVRIGTESFEWEQNKEKFRAELLPSDKESYELTVVFTEPQLFTDAQVSSITLSPEGDSTECSFFFHVGENTERIEARISIVYKNRVLQTALLKSAVLSELSDVSEKFEIEIIPEAIVRADFSGLKERRYFDAAFILNEDLNNEPKITAVKDQYVSFSTPEGLSEFNKQVDKFLTDIADDPENYAGKLDTKATVRLLSNLAEHGHILYDSLVDRQNGNLDLSKIFAGLAENNNVADTPKRIQIISANPDTRLPFEFLYDRPSPQYDDAGLCPKAVEGLEQGKCFTDCEGIKKPENYVCPLGFWGVSNIIERHIYNNLDSSDKVGGDFRFQAETINNRRHLEVFKKVLFAASDKADVLEENLVDGKTELKKGGVEKIISVLNNITNSEISKIASWDEWCEKIESDAPSALILLTHTQQTRSGLFALEIEEGKPDNRLLKSSSIEAKHVRFPEQNLPPIVFLIGCKTGTAKIDFTSFVTRFRIKGAAIIISTGATIRGRHAIPVVEELLNSLKEFTEKPSISFGEVMRVVKQKMLARGFPMVLTLMAYGDADWQIGDGKK